MRQNRPTRIAYYAWELPEELIEALRNADYGHLPSLKDCCGARKADSIKILKNKKA